MPFAQTGAPPNPPQTPIYYTPTEIGACALLAGWPESDLQTVIAVSMAESSGKANAVGVPWTDPTTGITHRAYGIMQCLYPMHSDLFPGGIQSGWWIDGTTNMRMARSIYGSQGWKAWETYTGGAYHLYSAQAAAAAASLQSALQHGGGNATNVAQSILSASGPAITGAQQRWAQATGGTVGPVAGAGNLTTPATDTTQVGDTTPAPTGSTSATVRFFEVVLGAALLLGGAYLFAKPALEPFRRAAGQVAAATPQGRAAGVTAPPPKPDKSEAKESGDKSETPAKKTAAKKTAAPAKKSSAPARGAGRAGS